MLYIIIFLAIVIVIICIVLLIQVLNYMDANDAAIYFYQKMDEINLILAFHGYMIYWVEGFNHVKRTECTVSIRRSSLVAPVNPIQVHTPYMRKLVLKVLKQEITAQEMYERVMADGFKSDMLTAKEAAMEAHSKKFPSGPKDDYKLGA
jgi:hypothetical protein